MKPALVRWLEVLGLIALVALGLAVRAETFERWQTARADAFFGDEPLLATADGYFYLRLARDLAEDRYAPVDELRAGPESPPRPRPAPLLSVAIARVASITGSSLERVGAALPPLLGVLLVLPLYALGRQLGGSVMGFTAAALGVTSRSYVYKTGFAWLDTDCLIATFAFSAASLCLAFGRSGGRRRYVYFGALVVVTGLFLWWWDQAPAAVAALVGLPFALACASFYRAPRREIVAFASACVLLTGTAIAVFPHAGSRLIGGGLEQLALVTASDSEFFPSSGEAISELGATDLATLADGTTGSAIVLALAGLGLLALAWRHPRALAVVAGPIALTALAPVWGSRFWIFLGPVAALGLGYGAARLWQLGARHRAAWVLAPLAVVALLAVAVRGGSDRVYPPLHTPQLVAGLDRIAAATPPDALVWSWWDQGYAVQYWARRTTVSDGQLNGGERLVYDALPLATSSSREAANFIAFFAAHGIGGTREVRALAGGDPVAAHELLRTLLTAGPSGARPILARSAPTPRSVDDWLRFLFPGATRPLYLFLDDRLARTAAWWHWFGSWSPRDGDGRRALYRGFVGVRQQGDVLVSRDGTLQVDLASGRANVDGESVELGAVRLHADGREPEHRRFGRGQLVVEVARDRGYAALLDPAGARSVFTALFLRAEGGPFFQLRLSRPYTYQLWELRPEVYPQ